MGRGLIKQKNKLKKEHMAPLLRYAEELEKENYALKNDPESLTAKWIGEFRELYSQNSRLSVLTASLIKKLGDSVRITKEEMAAFKGNRINIRWELPEGVTKPEDAAEYIFTFDLEPEPTKAPPISDVVVSHPVPSNSTSTS